jgi:sugar lactone lactonase YvrE
VTRRGRGGALAAIVAVGVAGFLLSRPATTGGEPILGVRPTYGPAAVSSVANDGAIIRRIWMPSLDQGWNPQGLAVAEGSVLVAGYRSDVREVHRGPCRVFRLDPRSGAETGRLEVPAPCGHAGGLAYDGSGRLYVADTHTLFVTNHGGAFDGPPPRLRVLPLGTGLTGALAVSAGDGLWIGTYREDGPGRLYRFSTDTLDRLSDGVPLRASDAAAQLPIPSHAQGAAIDRAGRLWVARSDLRWGEMDRLDLATGDLQRAYRAPPGLEGIAFDEEGRLWAVSEAGARHYYEGSWLAPVLPFYPLIVAIDPDRLQ